MAIKRWTGRKRECARNILLEEDIEKARGREGINHIRRNVRANSF